jgi:outer membrane murein-binding lipoprotein Lpp
MEITNVIELKAAIAALEQKRVIQEAILKKQYNDTIDHYRPKNLIKSAFSNILEPGETGNTILKAAGGIGAGFLAQNLLAGGAATSFIGKLASNAIKMGATNTVFNNTDKIAAWGKSIYKNLFTKDHSHHSNVLNNKDGRSY